MMYGEVKGGRAAAGPPGKSTEEPKDNSRCRGLGHSKRNVIGERLNLREARTGDKLAKISCRRVGRGRGGRKGNYFLKNKMAQKERNFR